MEFIKRPIQNVKTIEWKSIVWVGFWMVILLVWAIPVEAHLGFVESFKFLFSTNFYEVEEVSTSNAIYTTSMMSQSLNNIYQLLNYAKILFWFVTIIIILVFLFRNPNKQKLLEKN